MVKYLLVLSMFFATSVFAGGAGGSWGEPTQPTKPAPTTTNDYTGGGGKFGGGGAGGSWGNPVSCKFKSSGTSRIYTSATDAGNANCSHYRHGRLIGWYYNRSPDVLIAQGNTSGGVYPKCSGGNGGGGYIRFTCDANSNQCPDNQHYDQSTQQCVPDSCPEGQHLENGQCVPDDNDPECPEGQHEENGQCVSDEEPLPDDPSPDEECDGTCKCKAELEAIKRAIESLDLEVDLSSLESKLDALIRAVDEKNLDVDLSQIESQLSAIEKAIYDTAYDDSELQAKIDALADQIGNTNDKLDEIIRLMKQPKQCSDNPLNKKICDFIDWFQGGIPPLDDNSAVSVDDGSHFDWQSIAQNNYLTLPSSCPFNPLFNVPFLGKAASIVFPMDIVCRGAVMLKVLILLWASFTSLRIIGDTPL